MKQKIRLLLKSFICCAFVIITSCEKEDDHKEGTNVEVAGVVPKRISFNDFKDNNQIINELAKVNSKIEQLNKTNQNKTSIYDEANNFEIETDEVLYLEYGGLNSYTFLVNREQDNGKLENLVLSKNRDGNYSAKLIIYDLTDQEKNELENGALLKIHNKIETIVLDGFNTGQILSKSCTTTSQTIWVSCGSGEHDSSNLGSWAECTSSVKPQAYTVSITDCSSDNGGGDPDPGYGSPVGGYGDPYLPGGTGGEGEYPAYFPYENTPPEEYEGGVSQPFTPSLDFGDPDAEKTPCQELASLVDPARGVGNIKSKIDALKQKVNGTNNKTESGFSTKKNFSPEGVYSYVNIEAPVTNQYSVPIEYGYYFIGGAHSHPEDGHPIFSFGDVKLLSEIYKEASPLRKPEVMFMLVCKNSTTGVVSVYALKVNDFTALENALNLVWNDPAYASANNDVDKMAKILKTQGEKYDKCNGQFEKSFLQQFNNSGISLYSAANLQLTKWNKLELTTDPTNLTQQVVKPSPCN